LTISQEYLGNILPREKLKKVLDVGEVKVQTEDDAVKFFPPSAIWGREDPHSSPFASCAIVGNSPVLMKGGAEWGEEIDSHELVMRFNNAPTKVQACCPPGLQTHPLFSRSRLLIRLIPFFASFACRPHRLEQFAVLQKRVTTCYNVLRYHNVVVSRVTLWFHASQ
jgi:hypothetical protein